MFQAYIYNYSKVNPVAVNGVPLQLPVVTSNGVLKVPRTIGMGLDCDAYAFGFSQGTPNIETVKLAPTVPRRKSLLVNGF